MATTAKWGIQLIDDTMPTAPLEGLFNLQANSLDSALTSADTAIRQDTSPNVASQAERDALFPAPVQGNRVYRVDLGLTEGYFETFNASSNPGGRPTPGWQVAYAGERFGVATVAGGWKTPSVNRLILRGGWVSFMFNAFRSTDAVAGNSIGNIPVPFRSSVNVWTQAWGLAGASGTLQTYFDTATGDVKLNQPMKANQSIALYTVWPLA